MQNARQVVWIVDDSHLETELARDAIPPECAVEVFTDGLVVLERLAEGAIPSLLLVDWTLTEMTGLDLCRDVRARFDEAVLPIVVVSAFRRGHEDVIEALAAGANDFVSKPYRPTELRARIAMLLKVQGVHTRALRRGASSSPAPSV